MSESVMLAFNVLSVISFPPYGTSTPRRVDCFINLKTRFDRKGAPGPDDLDRREAPVLETCHDAHRRQIDPNAYVAQFTHSHLDDAAYAMWQKYTRCVRIALHTQWWYK